MLAYGKETCPACDVQLDGVTPKGVVEKAGFKKAPCPKCRIFLDIAKKAPEPVEEPGEIPELIQESEAGSSPYPG